MNICKWCGKEAKYYFKTTNNYCCSQYPQQCPEFKKILSKAKKGTKRSHESIQKQSMSMIGKHAKPKAVRIITEKLCDYGCGQIAKYKFLNGKFCCESNYRSCPSFISNKITQKKWSSKGLPIKIEESILCSFGCGKKAKYKFKNNKFCCSEYATQCSNMKRKLSFNQKKYLSELNKKPLIYWKDKYPLFSKIEHLSQTVGGELLVECKNDSCKKLFTPSYIQLYERIRQVENPDGNGGSYFYCSQKCKDTCSLFNLKSDPYTKTKKIYTESEYQTFRKFVLERDNYICQFCGKKATHVHHERPQKLEPFFALDPDFAWSCCEKCHYEKGHKDECSTGKLASKIC